MAATTERARKRLWGEETRDHEENGQPQSSSENKRTSFPWSGQPTVSSLKRHNTNNPEDDVDDIPILKWMCMIYPF